MWRSFVAYSYISSETPHQASDIHFIVQIYVWDPFLVKVCFVMALLDYLSVQGIRCSNKRREEADQHGGKTCEIIRNLSRTNWTGSSLLSVFTALFSSCSSASWWVQVAVATDEAPVPIYDRRKPDKPLLTCVNGLSRSLFQISSDASARNRIDFSRRQMP